MNRDCECFQLCPFVFILLSIYCDMLLSFDADSTFFEIRSQTSRKKIPLHVSAATSEVDCVMQCQRMKRCQYGSITGNSSTSVQICSLFSNDTSEPLIERERKFKHYHKLAIQGSRCFGPWAWGRTPCSCSNGQFSSCWDALQVSASSQGTYLIQPRCQGGAVKVECKRQGDKVISTVSHTVPANTLVNGYESCGSYKRTISYHGTIDSIVNLMKDVDTCRQLTELDCQYVLIYYPNGTSCSWLIGRGGNKLRYWGGGDQSGMGCECWKTRSCIKKSEPCNCSNYDTKPGISDSGYVTRMADLPLRSVAFGDTGNSWERLIYTIGPLQCETLV